MKFSFKIGSDFHGYFNHINKDLLFQEITCTQLSARNTTLHIVDSNFQVYKINSTLQL
jgi:hypothetical protein